MTRGAFTGTALMARVALRRSRWFWITWVAMLWLTMAATLSKFETIMGADPSSETARVTAAALEHNVTMRAMLGPPYDLLHAGPFTMWRVGTFVAMAAAMMAALGVIRATRAEEEDGRTELLRSAAIGRHAPLAGALLVSLGMCLLLALLVTVSMPRPWGSAALTGLGIGLVGAVWTGVGAVCAQLSESARAARSTSLGILGVAYLLRAVADGASPAVEPLQWASPVEWAALAQPYVADRWWVLVLPLVLCAVLVALAFRLEDVRDHGSGLRPARLGPADAAPSLRDAAGLAWRLDRGTIVGWTIAMAITGLAFGSMAGSVTDMVTENPQVEEMFRRMGGDASQLEDAFYAAMLGILVTIVTMLAVQLVLRLRHEEERGHAEQLLATGISRTRLALSHVVPALVAPTVLMALVGAMTGATQAITEGSASTLLTVAGGALALTPGIWVVVGIGTCIIGWLPRWGWLTWAVVGWSTFVVWLGALLELPSALVRLTPWHALPVIPGHPMEWAPVLATTVVAVLLLVVGLVGYRRRDLPA